MDGDYPWGPDHWQSQASDEAQQQEACMALAKNLGTWRFPAHIQLLMHSEERSRMFCFED